jgi:5'(3')-deoxyribonucleotidase
MIPIDLVSELLLRISPERLPEVQSSLKRMVDEGSKQAFVFGVDLDGVCANFYGGLKPIAAEWLGVDADDLSDEVSWGLPEWGIDRAAGGYQALHRFAVTQRELFRSLMPMPGAPQALRELSNLGIRVRIITHRLFIKHFHAKAISQTISWLDEHDIPYSDLCFMKDKAAVGADLYIDDSPGNVEALRADGHETIVFRNSTNRQVGGLVAKDWKEVKDIVEKTLASWKSGAHGGLSGR